MVFVITFMGDTACEVLYKMRYKSWIVLLLGSVTSSKIAAKMPPSWILHKIIIYRKKMEMTNVIARHP